MDGSETDSTESSTTETVNTNSIAADEGLQPNETGPNSAEHPFAASGEVPEGITIRQKEVPDYPDNLPSAPPPTQRLPSWILELEGRTK